MSNVKCQVKIYRQGDETVMTITGPQGSGKTVFAEKMALTLPNMGAREVEHTVSEMLGCDRVRFMDGPSVAELENVVRASRRAELAK